MKSRLLAAFAALALVIALPAVALANHISGESYICTGQNAGIYISGTQFSPQSNSPVTLTGPNGYLASYVVTTASWSTVFPLGDAGSYQLDWPNSGKNKPQSFWLQCSEPTPTPTATATPTPTATPTAKPTPTPEPCEEDCPTPTPTASPTQTPVVTPTPTPTPTAKVTIPPTSTAAPPNPPGTYDGVVIITILLLSIIIGAGYVWYRMRDVSRKAR